MYAVIDVGGTHTRIGFSADLKTFMEEPKVFDTPDDYNDGIERIINEVRSLSSLSALQGMAVGVAGILQDKALIQSPNLPEWVDQPLASDLSRGLSVPVLLENDAALAALGEAHFGNGTTEGILAYFTVSTGIGGARVEDGRLSKKALGFEPGHQIINLETEETIEAIAGGGALEKKHGQEPKEIDKSIWPKMSRYVAIAIYNSTLHWSPDLIVLGGSMTTNEPGLYEMIVNHLEDISTTYYPIPEVRESELNELNGLYGGLVLIEQKLTHQ